MNNSAIIISDEELDILQEVMNIAFGKASADLAEVIDIYVVLSIPDIKLLKTAEVPGYIEAEINDFENISVIKQNYTGKFHGSALLWVLGSGFWVLGFGGEVQCSKFKVA